MGNQSNQPSMTPAEGQTIKNIFILNYLTTFTTSSLCTRCISSDIKYQIHLDKHIWINTIILKANTHESAFH